ncbi:MAG: hypothetical protein V4582_11715 [Pseudomonadota bacterium]
MNDVSWLSAQACAQLFGADGAHVPLTLHRLRGARLLWLNRAVARHDPAFGGAAGGDWDAYERHVLAACAYAQKAIDASAQDFGEEQIVAHADRYGGGGIGLNGGSGRAAICNGYLVKGVGRTPLVSSLTAQSHASGGAYLEESVREAIYSEVVRAEFPFSAVPVLAIIDTGLVQVWQEAQGTKTERRTLLVRPCFARPAHFVRASSFYTDDRSQAGIDTLRVSRFHAHAAALLGKTRLQQMYATLWRHWASQLAYSFAHRLPHGSNTISNVCLDAKLLDFGAMSALPSWANIATMLARQPFAQQHKVLPGLQWSIAYSFGRYLDPALAAPAERAALATASGAAYGATLLFEVLRVCGLSRRQAQAVLDGDERDQAMRVVDDVIAHFQKEVLDMVESTPPLRTPWEMAQLWDGPVPAYLLSLQQLLMRVVAPAARARAAQRCRFVSATRTALFREELKKNIFAALDHAQLDLQTDRPRIEKFINEHLARARRDHRFDIDDAAPLGFAVGSEASFALFVDDADGAMFALLESPSAQACAQTAHSDRLWLRSISDAGMEFMEAGRARFEGAVHILAEHGAEAQTRAAA